MVAQILFPNTMPLVCGGESSSLFIYEERNRGASLEEVAGGYTSSPAKGPVICSFSESGIPPPELPSDETWDYFVYSFHKRYYFFAV